MSAEQWMSITIEHLTGMEEEPLRQLWADMRDFCNQLDQPRRLWNEKDARDDTYYHLRMMQAAALLILLGKWKWTTFSMSDVRSTAMEYFERANLAPLNGDEPRRFLEFLLEFKSEFEFLENSVDGLLIEIVDHCPDLGRHNFQNDPRWYDSFVRFAKGLRHRSVVYVQGSPVYRYELVEKMKDLYYDALAELVEDLANEISEDAEADRGRGRVKLATALEESVDHLKNAAKSLQRAWDHCRPHTDLTRKQYQVEHIFDPDVVRKWKIRQFVHSYMLTLRMHGETADEEPHYLSLLKGMEYHKKLAKDPDFEAMIDALIDALEIWTAKEAPEIERELNALIGRDVWSCTENREKR